MSASEDDWKATATLPPETGPGFTVTIGYEASNRLRAELEPGYRLSSWSRSEDIRLAVNGEPADTDGLQVEAVKGELATPGLMTSGLMDFDASWCLKPCVGAGIGCIPFATLLPKRSGQHWTMVADSMRGTIALRAAAAP